jgi:chaperonin GroES
MNKLSVKPLGNRVILKRLAEEKLKGGLVLPDSAKKPQEKAEVMATGPGLFNEKGEMIPMPVKVGDIVLIEKYMGQEVVIDEQDLLIVRANEIIATVEI